MTRGAQRKSKVSMPVKVAGIGAVVLVLATVAYVRYYQRPRAELEAQILAAARSVGDLEDQLAGEGALRKSLKEFGNRTLGTAEDLVEHRFRMLLTRIGVENGLEGVVVDQGSPLARKSPALNKLPTTISREMRARPDFYSVSGSLRGEGDLQEVLRVIAMVRAQPWVHRVDGFSIKPSPRKMNAYALRVEVSTAFMSDAGPTEEPSLVQASIESEQVWRPLLAKNMFREPPQEAPTTRAPEVVVAAAPAQPPQASAPETVVVLPAYGDWRLAGVAVGSRGPNAMFVNIKTGERQTVLIGGALLDAVLVDAAVESAEGPTRAIVRIDGKLFEIRVEETMASRRPL
ncbi:MAG: hypothetical protein SFZ23_13105 [Planctomycetota bacterium]|nr:hypothetical protein [Planctomycetota bacterium]